LGVVFDTALAKPLFSARMHWEHYWNLPGNRVYGAEELGEFFRGIDV
jgi:hypothetical protein